MGKSKLFYVFSLCRIMESACSLSAQLMGSSFSIISANYIHNTHTMFLYKGVHSQKIAIVLMLSLK